MKSITLTLFLIISTICNCQTERNPLVLNKLQTSKLTSTETHIYKVKSAGDQFLQIRLEQKGIDVKIVAINESGEQIATFDSPNGKNGPEIITMTLSEKGNYFFEVVPFSEESTSGEYTIELKRLESIGKTAEDRIDQIMSLYTSETPGASIAVMKEGEIVFSKGYGMANLEYDIPVNNSTIFHIASISKQFTAFSILLLSEEGKLGLDDDIRKYIPEVPDFGNIITLRHLANHTSGLRDQWELLVMAGWRMDDVITTEHVLKLISRQTELNFKPGEEFLYCNTGFTLLAEVVARVSGMPFAEFIENRIFEPLEMNNSLFYDDHEKIVKNRAYSYYKEGNGYKNSVLNYEIPGATSLFTTPEDLTKWCTNFENPKIGNIETIRLSNTQGVLNNGDSISYGFGQAIGSYNGLTNYYHGGADAGYRTFLTRFPNEKLTVVVFANEASFSSGNVANQIVEFFIGDLFQEEKVEEEQKENKGKSNETVVMKSILKTYTGDFELQPGFILNISLDDSTLYGQATGQEKLMLTPQSDTLFLVEGIEAKISFPVSDKNYVSHLTLHQGGGVMKALRLESFDKESVELSNYTGFFYSEELATGYSIHLVDGALNASHSKVSDFSITPLKEDTFSSTYWVFGSIQYVKNDSGEIIGFNVSNGRVRNLFFEKR